MTVQLDAAATATVASFVREYREWMLADARVEARTQASQPKASLAAFHQGGGGVGGEGGQVHARRG